MYEPLHAPPVAAETEITGAELPAHTLCMVDVTLPLLSGGGGGGGEPNVTFSSAMIVAPKSSTA